MSAPEARSILVVADEPAVCAVLARALREAGYGVETALGGTGVLDLARAGRHFSMVITNDLVGNELPADLVARLRGLFPDTPVLHVDEVTRYTPPDFSPAETISLFQPFSLEALRMVVRATLGGTP